MDGRRNREGPIRIDNTSCNLRDFPVRDARPGFLKTSKSRQPIFAYFSGSFGPVLRSLKQSRRWRKFVLFGFSFLIVRFVHLSFSLKSAFVVLT